MLFAAHPWVSYVSCFHSTVERRVDASETISLAFLVLLEQLPPVERVVFLLREVFEYDYAEIASFLGKSEAACRQAFSHHVRTFAKRLKTATSN